MSAEIPMMIAVRGFAVPVGEGRKKLSPNASGTGTKPRKALSTPSDDTLIFDCETTTDHRQNLRIGTYQLRKSSVLRERGIFYEPDILTARELSFVADYAAKHGHVLRTKDQFVREVFLRYAWRYGATVVGFNLPFDLSRLAIAVATSHATDMRGGFSLTLVDDETEPRLLIKHLTSKCSFIRFAQPAVANDSRGMRRKGFRTKGKTGFFVDVKTLGSALTGGSPSLASLARLLGTPHQKTDAGGHGGPLTGRYLDYAVNDTQVTWECYERLRDQYQAHGLTQTPLHRIYSEASLGKAYLRQMGITPWRKVQPDFPDHLTGTIMTTYYGGRSEVRIRKEVTRVLYCDFRSMYPTVCTNMGLWDFVTAQGIEWAECGEDITALLQECSHSNLKQRSYWKTLTVLVQIKPDGDILPVRAAYGGAGRTIGLNKFSSDVPMWFTLADCIASKLFTGKAPQVIRAIRFTPQQRQKGMKTIRLGGGIEIDPAKADFYKLIIDERGKAQVNAANAKNGNGGLSARFAAQSQMLKLLANSTSYGIFAELNTQSHDRPEPVHCHGANNQHFETTTKTVEECGTHFHPLIATLITGAARLMLAIAETVAEGQGIGWAFCDTDSMALARPEKMNDQEFLHRAKNITSWFDGLNPYEGDAPLFKVEKENFDLDSGKSHQALYALAVSAKRYVLFNLDERGRPIIRKAMAHGLGHLRPPYRDGESPRNIPAPSFDLRKERLDRWQYDLWYRITIAEQRGRPSQVDTSDFPNFNRPAVSRYSAATPGLLKWFSKMNEGKAYLDMVKPFNFMLSYHVSKAGLSAAIARGIVEPNSIADGMPALVSPFDDNPNTALRKAFDRNTGHRFSASVLQTARMAVAQYHLHPEAKFENGEFEDSGLTERRHIRAIGIEFIGKEANRWEEQLYVGELPEAQIEYGRNPAAQKALLVIVNRAVKTLGIGKLAGEAKLSRQQLHSFRKGGVKLRQSTSSALFRAISTLSKHGLKC